MVRIVREKITDPAAWVGPEIAKETHWYYHLDDEAVGEIDAALQAVRSSGLSIPRSARTNSAP